MTDVKHSEQPRVVIIGAGIAGISAAVALKNQLQFHNFIMYEKADAVGGTWRDNTYPECGSDVPGHWYSLSTEMNPNWTSYYVRQPEIRAYWEDIHARHGLAAHTVFNTKVEAAEWDSATQTYRVALHNVVTGVDETTRARAVIWAIGGFMSPIFPKDLPGIESFRGEAWHSARWRHDVDLKGKRIGVIGNGCSAAQFIPAISADPSVTLINFCRTPQWYFPRKQYNYPGWVKWLFAHVPGVMRLYRNYLMAISDMSFLIFRQDNKRLINRVKKELTNYIKHKAPKEYHDKLIPDYSPGCKRIIIDPSYLSCLHRPNVRLNWDGIDSIVEEGIKTKKGEIIPLDVIIFGTGFTLESADIAVRGKTGQTVMEYFKEQHGPTAYLGTLMPGFPNLFTLTGPNTASGHASIIFSDEVQIQYALQMLKPIIRGSVDSFDVKSEATDKYNTWLQGRHSRSVWNECHSYYRSGRDDKGKNFATFPGPLTLFWWLARHPHWSDFNIVGRDATRFTSGKGSKGKVLALLAITALMVTLVSRTAGLKLGFDWHELMESITSKR